MGVEPVSSIKIVGYEESCVPSKHIVYIIEVKGVFKEWLAVHRYSDFQQLHKALINISELNIDIPPKLNIWNTNESTLLERSRALELYLRSILYSKQTAFRRSPEFMDFILIPKELRNIGTDLFNISINLQQIDGPEQWLTDYSTLLAYLVEIRQCLNLRVSNFQKGDVNAYQSSKFEYLRLNIVQSKRSAQLNHKLID
jgi:hypothetical protein